MRYRSRGDGDFSSTGKCIGHNGTIVPYTDTPYTIGAPSVVYSRDIQTISDVKTANFFRRIKNGELIINPCIRTSETLSVGGGSMSGTSYANNQHDDWYYQGPSVTLHARSFYDSGKGPIFPTLNVPDKTADVKLAAIAKIAAPNAYLMEDLLSYHETVNLLRHPLQAVVDTLKNFQKGPLTGASSSWLFYANAMRPLYGSLSDLADNISAKGQTLQKGVRLRATATASGSDQKWSTSKPGTCTYNVSLTRESHWRAVIFYKVRVPIDMDFTYRVGLRLQDIPVGVWNRVGLSYMVDRVVNISQAMRATMNLADPNIMIEGGCVSSTINQTSTQQLIDVPRFPPATTLLSGDLVTWNMRTYARDPWNPSFTDVANVPVHFGRLIEDASKTADLASLAYQQLMRLHR